MGKAEVTMMDVVRTIIKVSGNNHTQGRGMSIIEIAVWSQHSPSTVRRALKRAAERGWVCWTERKYGKHGIARRFHATVTHEVSEYLKQYFAVQLELPF